MTLSDVQHLYLLLAFSNGIFLYSCAVVYKISTNIVNCASLCDSRVSC